MYIQIKYNIVASPLAFMSSVFEVGKTGQKNSLKPFQKLCKASLKWKTQSF